MKLLLKKAEVAAAPHWHPNFRNAEALPDLKLVRTSFFVNAACITVALVALLLTAYREYLAYNLRTDISRAEQHMDSIRAKNTQLLEMSREFDAAARKFAEAKAFVTVPLDASTLLVALGKSLPEHIELTSVSYDGQGLTLLGTIQGTSSESAATRLSDYRDELMKDPMIGPCFSEITLSNFIRDASTQIMSFEIHLRAAAKDAKAKQP